MSSNNELDLKSFVDKLNLNEYVIKEKEIATDNEFYNCEEKDSSLNKISSINVMLLEGTLEQTKNISNVLKEEVEEKRKLRKCIVYILLGMLVILLIVLRLVVLKDYDYKLIYSIIGLIVSNLFSILYIFTKYSTDNSYNATYKELIWKQLDYIKEFYKKRED